MARPKEFDRDQALRAAAQTVWERGYGGTSVQNLVTCMGIHRASLYDTFGSKQALFEEVLRHYTAETFERRFATLRLDASPLARVERFFQEYCARLADPADPGCLVVKSAVASDDDLGELRPLIQDFTARADAAFLAVLSEAREQEELDAATELAPLARHLRNSLFGPTVSAAARCDREELEGMVRTALACHR